MRLLIKFLFLAGFIGASVFLSFYYSREFNTFYNKIYSSIFFDSRKTEKLILDLYKEKQYEKVISRYRSDGAFFSNNMKLVVSSAMSMKNMDTEAAELYIASINGAAEYSVFLKNRKIAEFILRSKNYGDLLLMYDKGIALNDANFAFYYGVALYHYNRYPEAERMLNYAFENGYIGSEINYYISLLFEKKGNLGRAVFFMERAFEYGHRDRDVLMSLIRLYRKNGDYKKSEVILRKLK